MAYGTIKFANGGEINLLANAATKYRFRQIFGLDLMDEMENATSGRALEIFEMLTYTMMLQANKEAEKGSIDGFFAWLESMESAEITDHVDTILAIYQGNQKTTSTIKNQDGPPSAR